MREKRFRTQNGMTLARSCSKETRQRGLDLRKPWRRLRFPALPNPSHLSKPRSSICFLYCYDAHPSRRIWQLPTAVETANIIEAATIAVGPRCVTMDAIKHIGENPLDPRHSQDLVKLCGASARVGFRGRALSARRIKSVIFLRARAVRAFTVPWGTPRIRAVSRIDRPSMWRSWYALRKTGLSWLWKRAMRFPNSESRQASSGLGQ